MVLGEKGMKKKLISIFAILISSVFNITIFLVTYEKLVFPFLHEDQRMDNAPYIFTYVIPGFVAASVISFLLVKYVNKFDV